MIQSSWLFNDGGLPLLLRAARNTYASAVRQPLAARGYDDIPRNGVFVIGALSRDRIPLGEVIGWLGVSKQAAGNLVDTLVLRGYLYRAVDEADRRRLTLGLTARGREVAAITRAAVEEVDGKLAQSVGVEHIAHTRATLMALISQSSEPS
jgi:DNA-binding MarR family transcriptional regulator